MGVGDAGTGGRVARVGTGDVAVDGVAVAGNGAELRRGVGVAMGTRVRTGVAVGSGTSVTTRVAVGRLVLGGLDELGCRDGTAGPSELAWVDGVAWIDGTALRADWDRVTTGEPVAAGGEEEAPGGPVRTATSPASPTALPQATTRITSPVSPSRRRTVRVVRKIWSTPRNDQAVAAAPHARNDGGRR
jgi:hypothetical protein